MHVKNKRPRARTNANTALKSDAFGTKTSRVPDSCCRDASVRSSASQAAWFPQTRAGFSREFCVIWAGRRGEEKEGLGVDSGAPLKAKQDVSSQILSCYSPPLLQLRGRRQHDTSQPESSRKMRKGCGGNQPDRHQTGHNLKNNAGRVKACVAAVTLISLCSMARCISK